MSAEPSQEAIQAAGLIWKKYGPHIVNCGRVVSIAEIIEGQFAALRRELEAVKADKERADVKLGRLVLNDTTRDILGRPGFTVRNEAHMLRDSGYTDVARKTEDEQAVALFWMLMLYVEHGDKWREKGGEEVRARCAKIEASAKENQGGAS